MRGIGCCPRRRHTTIIVGQNPKPAAAFPRPFDGDELHLLSGISDLSFAKSALCASLYNQGCRRRPVRQNVLQKDFCFFSPARRLFGRPFGRWGRPALSRLNMSLATAVIPWLVHRDRRNHIRGFDLVGVDIVGIDRNRFAVMFV